MTVGRKPWFVGLLAILVLCMAPSAASAAVITVNTITDTPINTNDGVCTLREAIDSANTNTDSGATAGECAAGSGTDSIEFSGAVFNGTHPGSTIGLVSANGNLPAITETVTIDGCSATPNSAQPCVGIERAVGSGALTVFDVNANNVAVAGVAITTPNGIPTRTQDNVTGFTLKNSWYGTKLDQTAVGTGTVTILGNGAVIGGDGGAPGTGPADRNVFAGTGSSTIPSLRIQGDNNQVRGNYFGVMPDGATLAFILTSSPADQIVVQSAGTTSIGNSIGGTIDSGSATECDDACNVIAGANGSGIDLEGGGTPAGTTTVAGNHIGLDKTGTLDRGNGSAGISVGGADNVTIGGVTAPTRNLISGNAIQGIDTGAGSTGLVVGFNFIGLNLAGTAAIPNDVQGAVINGGGTFSANRLGGTVSAPTSGGLVIGNAAGGGSTTARGNVIGIGTGGEDVGLPGTGISVNTFSASTDIGGPGIGEGNVIGNMRAVGSSAIGISADDSTVRGNLIGVDSDGTTPRPNDGTGIQLVSDADNAQIGGTTAGSENTVSNNALDAIEIVGDGTDLNAVLRNRGSGNGTGGTPANNLFLDLTGTDGSGNGATGPNNAIETTNIVTANSQTISGNTNVNPGDVVRVYRTNTAAGQGVKDIVAFAGSAIVDGSGNWTVTCPSVDCPSELPGTGQVTANVTRPTTPGESSEFTNAVAYLAAPPPSPPPTGGGTTPAAPVTPTTAAAAPAPKKCKKGQKLKNGKCVKKKRRK
jgi:CSLREA domain-containing protein